LFRIRKYRILCIPAGVVLFFLGILVIVDPNGLYELYVNVEGEGRVSPGPGILRYIPGDIAYLQAEPSPDSMEGFVEWRGDATGTDDRLTVKMDGNKKVTAVFSSQSLPGRAFKTLTIAVNGPGAGTTSPEPGVYRHLPGKSLNVFAVPGEQGYFSGWTITRPSAVGTSGGNIVVDMAPRTAVKVDDDVVLVASFQSRGHTLTVERTGEGNVLPEPGTYALAEGSKITLTALPKPGYRLRHWSDASGSILHIPEREEDLSLNLVISADQVCQAVFEKAERRLVLRTSLEGSARGRTKPESSGAGADRVVPFGETLTLQAVPEDGNTAFAGWSGDIPRDLQNTQVLSPELSLVMDEDRRVTARFVEAQTRLRFRATVDGAEDARAAELLLPPPGVYGFVADAAAGIELRASMKPGDPLAFSCWEGDLPPGIDGRSPFLHLPMDRDRQVTARFVERDAISLVLYHDGDGQGVSAPAVGTYAVAAGRPLSFEATPATGEYFAGWRIEEADHAPRTFLENPLRLALTGAARVGAVFGRKACAISVDATDSGARTTPPRGLYETACGSELTLRVTLPEGKYFHYWSNGAGDIVSEEPETNVTITGDESYLAVLGPPLYGLKVTTGGTGTGSVEADRERLARVVQGESVSLTALPGPDSVFSHWEGDLPQGANPQLPCLGLSMDGDKHVIAVFEPADFTLTVDVLGAEGHPDVLLLPGRGMRGFRAGTEVRLVAFPSPDGGVAFTGWTGDIASPNPEHALVMDKDIHVQAVFAPVDSAAVAVLELLPVSGDGKGGIRPVGPGRYAFVRGAAVRLSLELDSGSYFGGWGRDYAANIEYSGLQVVMDRDRMLAPEVSLRGATLVLMVDGKEGGTVSPPAGVYRLAEGLETALTAQCTNDDYVFQGWHDPGGGRLSSRVRYGVKVSPDVPRTEIIAVFRKYLAPPELVLCHNRR